MYNYMNKWLNSIIACVFKNSEDILAELIRH